MKIYRKCVIDIATWTIESEDSYEYAGTIADCKGKGGNPPASPDPNVVSAAQTSSNKETAAYNAALNRGNVYTPLGSQTFTSRGKDPDTGAPIYDETISLSEDQQALLDQQNQQNRQLGNIAGGMMGQVENSYKGPLDTSMAAALRDPGVAKKYQTSIDRSNLPALKGELDTSGLSDLYGANDLEGARKQTQDALYSRQAAYLDPQWAQRDTAFRTRMANQGITEGSEAWKNGLDDENRARSFDYDQARNSAIVGGGDEVSRLTNIALGNRGQQFNESVTGGNFQNTARGQGFNEGTSDAEFGNRATGAENADNLNYTDAGNRARAQALDELYTARAQPLNEFNALRTASPVNLPQFQQPQAGSINPTDVAGNVYRSYQGDLNVYGANQAGQNATTAGLFGLGGSALGAAGQIWSDKRLKENIDKVGELPDDTNLYEYNLKGSPVRQVGVMAQEVEKTDPGAVTTDPKTGFKKVNYSRVLAKALRAQ